MVARMQWNSLRARPHKPSAVATLPADSVEVLVSDDETVSPSEDIGALLRPSVEQFSTAPSAPAAEPIETAVISPTAEDISALQQSAEQFCPATKATAAEPMETAALNSPAPQSLPGWRLARPICETMVPESAEMSEFQLATLTKARALHEAVTGRMPTVDGMPTAASSEKGHRVHNEADGHLSVSVMGHPKADAEATFDVRFVDTWTTDIVLRGKAIGTGLLPLVALLREPDLVADYLPRASGLPYIESLEFANFFAPNDWVYRCFVSPFGPLPGADDLHSLTFFDLLDEPEGGLLFYAESPPEGRESHRGWPVPPVKSWRRKRNYVLGATSLVRPSAARPLNLEPPAHACSRCLSPGCTYLANSALSCGGGTHCCEKCKEHPGKHGASCERRAATGPVPAWALAVHGCVDLTIVITLKLPVVLDH